MKNTTPKNAASKRPWKRHPGGHTYAALAKRLGCSTQHLHLVVKGKRTSLRLLSRYIAIVGS